MQESHLYREIAEQPEVLRTLLSMERSSVEAAAEAIRQRAPSYIMVAARGSSDNAARYGQYLFGTANRIPIALATPSLFTLYKQPPRLDGAVVLGISQSGESPDIVSVLETGRQQGLLTVAITNNTRSALASVAEHVICLHAGPEQSIAATKTYTASLLALAMLSSALAEDAQRLEALAVLPELVEEAVGTASDVIRLSERYRYADACVVVSRGYNYATAFEISLKLKELSYIVAEPYSSADFQHGPSALVDRGFPVIIILPDGEVADELLALLREQHDHRAELVVISAREVALNSAQTPLRLPSGMPEWLSPIVAVVPGQLFALGLALVKGLDPDKPRRLQKVTRTW